MGSIALELYLVSEPETIEICIESRRDLQDGNLLISCDHKIVSRITELFSRE
jgi:hypothetical protein